MSKTVSVIVPVYNAQAHLRQCLASIVNQTYRDLEILIINDGSTDDSYNICQEFAKKDSRIKLFNKTNGGVSKARNLGLKNATGEYVMFVDADDYLEIGCISSAIYAIQNDDSDIVAFGYNRIEGSEVTAITEVNRTDRADFFMFDRLVKTRYSLKVWNKLIKRKIIIKYFNEFFANSEDFLFNSQFFGGYLNISVIGDVLYNYRDHKRCLCKTYTQDYLQNLNIILDKVCRNLDVNLGDIPHFCGFLLLNTLKCLATKNKDQQKKILLASKNFRKILVKNAKFKKPKYKFYLLLCKMGLTKLVLKLI